MTLIGILGFNSANMLTNGIKKGKALQHTQP